MSPCCALFPISSPTGVLPPPMRRKGLKHVFSFCGGLQAPKPRPQGLLLVGQPPLRPARYLCVTHERAARQGEKLCQTIGQSLSFEDKHWRAVNINLQKGPRMPGGQWLPGDPSGRAPGWHLAAQRHRGPAAGSKTQHFLARDPQNEL